MPSSDPEGLPRLYRDLASWFPLLTPPEDYAEEAELYAGLIEERSGLGRTETLLELGSGGGHNASHLKRRFKLTLVDLSPDMLQVSRRLNPECEHLVGDMRWARLGRQFDTVLIHDAISYMTSEKDLRAALDTAFVHSAPGGVALFAPDYVRESFKPATQTGGSDGEARALRYLEWSWDPDPADTTYTVDMAYLLRDEAGEVDVALDRHILGLFPRATWQRLIESAGFRFEAAPLGHSAPGGELFIGVRPR